MSLLSVRDLEVTYPSRRGPVRVIDGVSFDMNPGETIGLVGESGCGKSTLGKAILRLVRPSAGAVVVDGTDVTRADTATLTAKRRQMQMVFQDPFGSLNPRQSVMRLLDIPLRVHGVRDAAARRERIELIADAVGIPRAALSRYPHEFSGGQRQRIGIARALILRPQLLICDEPVSALDLSIQAQILNLLADLKTEFNLSYVFISHDLSVVRYISDRVLVMYLGRIVEDAPHRQLFAAPRHPYTRALLGAVPSVDPDRRIGTILRGEIGSGVPAQGCRFRARCPMATDRCATEDPALRPVQSRHNVACHLAE